MCTEFGRNGGIGARFLILIRPTAFESPWVVTADLSIYFLQHCRFHWCLTAEKPGFRWLAVPGMPVGSPGMEVDGAADQPYDVIAFDKSGQMAVFASYRE